MSRTSRLALLLVAVAASVGCGKTTIAAPEAGELVTLTLATRPPVAGEQFPQVEIGAVLSGVRFRVTRPDLCATIATAAVNRAGRDLAIVARVSGNPLALCTADLRVLEYSGAIPAVAPGVYRVRVFEAVGGVEARLIASGSVTVH